MKNISINIDNTTDQKELESLLSKIKTVLSDREEAALKAVMYKDLTALKLAFQYNQDLLISQKIWDSVNFRSLTYKDLDFFLFFANHPAYEYHNLSRNGNPNKTGDAIISSFKDKDLFNYFVNDKIYSDKIKSLVPRHAINNTTSKDVIYELYKHKILSIDKDSFNVYLENGLLNFVECIIEKNIVKLNNQDYKKIYLLYSMQLNNNAFNIVKKSFPKYKDFSLHQLLTSWFDDTSHFGEFNTNESYKTFIRLPLDRFVRTLNHHPVDETSIKYICKHLNNEEEQIKFEHFVETIKENQPDYIQYIKNLLKDSEYKKNKNFYDKILMKANLDIELPTQPKKIKHKL